MKNLLIISVTLLLLNCNYSFSQVPLDSLLPVRGLSIGAPSAERVNDFVSFIKNELAPNSINTLILLVDYKYQYESHPELRDKDALSKKQVKLIVQAAKENHIRVIPQINLLGHQSDGSTPGKLLEVYPQFDETPWVKFPEKYVWPNPDKLYCKSYCPLHPEVHKIVFELVDELTDVFETNAFHAGMDEVFYLGEEKCPRCQGHDKARLFADEVRLIHDHLASKGKELWIWGDRLLNGSNTGLGEWEASWNNTWKAADWIPTDIMICDWHYENAEPTAVYHAMKGFNVLACPWRIKEVGLNQFNQILSLRKNANPVLGARMKGFIQTVWNDADHFMDNYYNKNKGNAEVDGSVECFKTICEAIKKLK